MTSTAPLELFGSKKLCTPDHRRVDPAGRFARLRWDYVAAGAGRSREQVSLIVNHDRASHQFAAMARRVHYDGQHTRALRDGNACALAIALPTRPVDRYSRDDFIAYVQSCEEWLTDQAASHSAVYKLFDPELRVYNAELDT